MSRVAEEAIRASYKALKEDFVSNLTGTSITEINQVTAVAPVAFVLWSVLQSRHAFFQTTSVLVYTVDFLINIVALLLATTLYASHPVFLGALLLAPVPVLYLLGPSSVHKPRRRPFRANSKKDIPNPLPKRPFLTTYRGSMLAITSLSILSVDFQIFPRRFAKVESWGTSLMDVGVGSFVFSAGIVGARPLLQAQLSGRNPSLTQRLAQAVRHSTPLLVLGLIRLWSVKGLHYAEHVSEYGVHWNFFFTLGFLPPFLALLESVFQYIPSYAALAYAALALLIGVAYQLALELTGLKAYILTAERTNLLSMNREGIFSFWGYLAIFLAGQATGMFVLPHKLVRDSSICNGWTQRRRLLQTLGAWSVGWTLLFLGCTNLTYGLNLGVSRRLANLPYFLWIAAFNTCQLNAFCLVETIFFPATYDSKHSSPRNLEAESCKATSRVLAAFNRNGLAVFLVANLLTGAVNLSVPTLHLRDGLAMGILVTYAAVVTGVAVGLDWADWSFKL